MLPETYVAGFHDPEVVKRMPYSKFGRSGRLISKLSLGASSFGNAYGPVKNEADCHEVILKAVKGGINLIDTAPWYGHGQSEEILGRALKAVPRSAYYLSTKARARGGAGPAGVRGALRAPSCALGASPGACRAPGARLEAGPRGQRGRESPPLLRVC